MDNQSGKHLIFYDGTCGMCDHAVRFILKVDRQEQFVFAPLQGDTAYRMLKDLPAEMKQVDSLILIEDFRSSKPYFFMESKAVWRSFWLLGSFWVLLGWLCFLPSFLFDWAYRIVARNRRRFFSDVCMLPDKAQQQRFLP